MGFTIKVYLHSEKNPPGIFHYSEIQPNLDGTSDLTMGFYLQIVKNHKTRLALWNTLRRGSHKVNLSSIHWFYLAHFHSFHLILTHKSFIRKDESDNWTKRIWL